MSIIIVGPEPIWKSIARDTYTTATAIIVIGGGVYLESSAMQWFGFLVAAGMTLSRAAGLAKANTYKGQAAIDRVAELVGEVAE